MEKPPKRFAVRKWPYDHRPAPVIQVMPWVVMDVTRPGYIARCYRRGDAQAIVHALNRRHKVLEHELAWTGRNSTK